MARSRSMLTRVVETAVGIAALVLIAVFLGLRSDLPAFGAASSRTVPVSAVVGGAPTGAPDVLESAAAQLLRESVVEDGPGYRFEIVQRSTINARPGGPQVPIPDPVDPRGKPIGLTDSLYQVGLVETGFVTPAGFSMTMRAGPMSPDAKLDLAAGQILFEALVKDGTTYRNDGEGWYRTDRPPGIGLDPVTASLLPRFLDRATKAVELDKASLPTELGIAADAAARAIGVETTVADLPGVIAVDGAPFTELTGPVTLTFDGAGRLSGLLVRARNTNLDTFDLSIVTEIAIRYDAVPTVLPDPLPAYSAPSPAAGA